MHSSKPKANQKQTKKANQQKSDLIIKKQT
jgi:hypothetical protein